MKKILKWIYIFLFCIACYFVFTLVLVNYLPDFMFNMNICPVHHIENTESKITENENYVKPSDDLSKNAEIILNNLKETVQAEQNIPEVNTNAKQAPVISLDSLIPYDWDSLYLSYSPDDEDELKEIEKEMHVKDNRLSCSSKNGGTLILVKDHKVIAYKNFKDYTYLIRGDKSLIFHENNPKYEIYYEDYNNDFYYVFYEISEENYQSVKSLSFKIENGWVQYASELEYDKNFTYKKDINATGTCTDEPVNGLHINVYEREGKTDEEILQYYGIDEADIKQQIEGYNVYYYRVNKKLANKNHDFFYHYTEVNQGYILLSDNCYYYIGTKCQKGSYYRYTAMMKGILETIKIDENYYK